MKPSELVIIFFAVTGDPGQFQRGGASGSKVTQEASDTATVQSREADPSLSKTLPDWDMGPPTEWMDE